MNVNIGINIKNLRLSKGLTQEQLAKKMNISAQAISKWETGTTMPDIQLLPELSVILGVTIDELFTLTDNSRFERIDNMIYDVRFISETEFEETERFLNKKRLDDKTRAKATLLLAMLYNKRADEYHELAAPLAREALILNPEDNDANNAIFDSENGAYPDWNCSNHHKLIDFYKAFVKDNPRNRAGHLWLLDLLIADGRCAEAREYCEKMKSFSDTYHYPLYMGKICKQECNLPKAIEWFKSMIEKAPESWIVYAMYADEMAQLCRYDEAIAYYKRAMPMRPHPQFIDCEEAVAHIYEIKGDYQNAIEMQKKIIELMKNDWNELEGEGIDQHLREIERLKSLA